MRLPPVRFRAVAVSMPGTWRWSEAAEGMEAEVMADTEVASIEAEAEAARGRIQWRSAANNLSGSMGLARWSFMPDERHISRSRSMALAVMARMGREAKRGFERMALVAVMPSMTGICMSIRIRS